MNFGSEADIARVDPYDSSDQPAHSPLLNRLKKLNTEALDGTTATDGKTITPFADSSYPIGGKNLHVAGFPKRPADKSDGRPQ
ncbi:hypothetical protein FACS1894218_1940 [Bacilli bacterium]|nr:hypothetical protein FACS1894218_1940 [Bacilli bacterium]